MANEKKEVQNKILFIYKQVLPLLEANNINFTANGGTCIGACREKGFIAWDDDMDINIHPDDKKKFYDMCDNLPGDLIAEKAQSGLYKIKNKNITHKGKEVFIDFFILEYVRKQNKMLKLPLLLLNMHFYYNWNKVMKTNSITYKTRWIFRILTFWFPTPISRWIFNKIIISKNKKFISEIVSYEWYVEAIHEVDIYNKRIRKPFEDTYIYVVEEFDKHLTQRFGNWNIPIDWNKNHYK